MSDSTLPRWTDRTTIRLDRQDPYLHIQHVGVFVRDQDRSLRFYVDKLGFTLAIDASIPTGGRWVAVAPPDGGTMLSLVVPNSEHDSQLIGGRSQVAFFTEDVEAKFRQWSERGVKFGHPPKTPEWGGIFTTFDDIDGNTFILVGFDALTREVEEHRREIAGKLEAERRAAQEMEIAKQVQARLFPQTRPPLETLDYAGVCIQAREVGG